MGDEAEGGDKDTKTLTETENTGREPGVHVLCFCYHYFGARGA